MNLDSSAPSAQPENTEPANDNAPDPVRTYRDMGMRPIVLHGVRDGRCTCGKYPCGGKNRSAGKHPVAKDWKNTIAESLPEGRNLGLAMGHGFIALDEDAEGAIARLENKYGALPATLTSRSGSGGRHLIFRVPEDANLGNSIPWKKEAYAVDVRGEGGQIVVWPSVHQSGAQYEWENAEEIADLPKGWLDALQGKRTQETVTSGTALPDLDDPRLLDPERPPSIRVDPSDALEYARLLCLAHTPAVEGEGGESKLLGLARRLVTGLRFTPEAASEIALRFYNSRCDPPWDMGDPHDAQHWERKFAEAAKPGPVPEGYLLTTPAFAPTTAGKDPWNWVPADRDPANVPPVSYVCDALEIVAGELSIVAGYGNGGKTLLCQDLALCVAFGRKILGEHPVTQGLVVHLSWETGERMLGEKYRRLALARGIPSNEIWGRIRTADLPMYNLTTDGIEEELVRKLEGVTLCIIDSLTAATAGVEQNKSEFGQVCYMLNRVAERTGCAIVLIHHANKTGEGSKALTGHSSVYNAVRGVGLLIERDDGSTIAHLRSVKSTTREVGAVDFRFKILDTSNGGLMVGESYVEPSADMIDRLREWFDAQPERTVANKSAVTHDPGRCPGKKEAVSRALQSLVDSHEIIVHLDKSLTYNPKTPFWQRRSEPERELPDYSKRRP